MGIIINDNLTTFSPKPLDSRFGPYSSTTFANTSVITANRYIGLTVGILTGVTDIVEYWYLSGITDLDLVLKTSGGGTGT